MSRFALVLLATAGWLAAASSLAAQTADPVFLDTVEVELVLVDLYAEDRTGRPVVDLAPAELRLFEDDRPVEISQFTAPAGEASAPARGEASLRVPGRFVIFLDNLHLGAGSRARAIQKVADLVQDALRPGDEVMVVSYTGRVDVVLPMTADRRELRRALREQAASSSILVDAQLADSRILHVIASQQQLSTLSERASDPCTDIGFIARTHAEQVYGRVTQTIRELELLVNSLAAYPGRKALLHVSDGIPVVAGLEAYRYAIELCDGSGRARGLENAVDTVTTGSVYSRWDSTKAWAELTQFDTTRDWTRLAAEANTYQVSFYTLQAAPPAAPRPGSVDDAKTSLDTQIEGYRGKQDSLFLLADETGGLAILDRSDFAPDLTRMVEDSRRGYQIAYAPPTPGDGKPHRIRVEITRPGVEIRYRRSYRSKSAHERVADAMLASLLHGRNDNPHEIRLEIAERAPLADHLTRVRLRVHVPFSHLVLLPEGEGRRGLFTVFVAARNDRGEMTPVGQRTVPVRLPATGGEPEFVYEVELPLRDVEHAVAIGLRDEIGSEVSFLTRTVPAGSAS